jgi:chromosome segregation ATPase
MRYAALLLLPLSLPAQQLSIPGQQPLTDQKLTEALVAEMHQLRLAVERSSLVAARAQLAIGELQVQQEAVTRLTAQYNELRSGSPALATRVGQLTDHVKQLEQAQTTTPFTNPQQQQELEQALRNARVELEGATATAQQRSAQEAELAAQLQQAQGQAADSRSRIAQMEAALDSAIQELLKDK